MSHDPIAIPEDRQRGRIDSGESNHRPLSAGYVHTETGRVAVLARDYAHSDLNGDAPAYWYNRSAESLDLDPWRLVEGVDPHTQGDGMDVVFADGSTKSVGADATIFLSLADAQKCNPQRAVAADPDGAPSHNSQIQDLAEIALNAACQTIQAALGVTDGGLASRHFSSDITRADLEEYIRLELLNKRMEAQDRAEASIVASLCGQEQEPHTQAQPSDIVGYLVQGEQSHLWVNSPERPAFTVINSHDPVVSITAMKKA